jgi:ATP-binding cassette subfamily B (MDR/TAP) protein 6
MDFVIPPGILEPVFILRVLSPALVLITTVSLLSQRPQPAGTPSPITSVIVANVVPRRASILFLLSLVSISYFLDGAAFVGFTVLDKVWTRHTGIEINAVVGVAAFAGLAALGSWKDVNGVKVWTLRRIKLAVAFGLLLDAGLVVLLGLKIRDTNGNSSLSSMT